MIKAKLFPWLWAIRLPTRLPNYSYATVIWYEKVVFLNFNFAFIIRARNDLGLVDRLQILARLSLLKEELEVRSRLAPTVGCRVGGLC
jgi:hypothetical protein